MKKKNILMVLAMLIVSVAYSQSVYYYTNGEKRYLRLEDNRRFVLVKTSDTTAFKRNCSIKMGDWREATGEQLEELRRIAEKKNGRSSVMSRGVLCFFFDECDGEDCLSSTTKSKGTESAPLRPCLVNGKEYSILNRIPCELKGENADNYSNALSCCINKKYKILSASVQTYHDKSYFQPQLLSSQDSVEGVSNIYVREDTLGRIYRYYPALDTEVVVCDMSLMPGDTF